jgi:hypothetical protein
VEAFLYGARTNLQEIFAKTLCVRVQHYINFVYSIFIQCLMNTLYVSV